MRDKLLVLIETHCVVYLLTVIKMHMSMIVGTLVFKSSVMMVNSCGPLGVMRMV